MHDLEGQAGSIQDTDHALDVAKRRRRTAAVLSVVLLILLLLCFCSVWTGMLRRTTPATSKVISDNRECLACHVELLPEFDMNAVHNPFEHRSCRLCHTDHGALYAQETQPGDLLVYERCGIVITWEPLRRALRDVGCGACGRLTDLGARRKPQGSAETTSYGERKKSELVAPLPRLCFTCHGSIGRLTAKAYQHTPFEKGQCIGLCHRPHASMYDKILTLPVPRLCPSCHRIQDELALPDVHVPFEQRECVLCHQPHASDFKGVLQAQQKVLCFRCHPQVAALTAMPVQHSPFINGQCTGCHKPHSSVPRKLLISPEPELCYTCHPAIRFDFLKPSHHPVGTPLLNCSDCHQPHAALYRKLLIAQDNRLCYTCHGDKEFFYVRSAHDRIMLFGGGPGLCINCHTPHGSVWAPMLIKEGMATCLQCHPTKISEADLLSSGPAVPGSGGFNHDNHPVGDGWRDQLRGGRLTCYSSCHDPHGTGRRAMLKRLPDGLCLQCHRVKELP